MSLTSILIDAVYIAIGLALLYYGANFLVSGAEQLGKKLGLSSLVIGTTIVAFGTSAPELAVTIDAALTDNPDIALANIVGSNLANIGLVAGLIASIGSIRYAETLMTKDMRFMLVATLLLAFFLRDLTISRIEGAILFSGLVIYVGFRLIYKDTFAAEVEKITIAEDMTTLKCLGLVIGGLLVLVFGGNILVVGASSLALDIGVSPAVIGFTIVAIGSSLPEVATSLYAVRSGRGGIALGNIVGSNIWNILGVLGLSTMIIPIAGQTLAMHMIAAMVGSAIILWLMLKTAGMLTRLHGCILVIGYLLYQVYALVGV